VQRASFGPTIYRLKKERVMFYATAKKWIEELRAQNKLKETDSDALERLARDYAKKLEEIFDDAVKKQLQPANKSDEYERMHLWDSQYAYKYLNQTIPSFHSFREEVFNRAKKIILG
jgi:hypothetical protein